MLELTEQQSQAVDQANEEPVRLTDARTNRQYVLIRVEVYERLWKVTAEEVDPSLYEFEDGPT